MWFTACVYPLWEQFSAMPPAALMCTALASLTWRFHHNLGITPNPTPGSCLHTLSGLSSLSPSGTGASLCGLETLAFIMLANAAEFHHQLEKKPGPFPTAAMTSERIHLCLKLGNHFPGGPFSSPAQSSLSKSFSSGFVCLYPRGLA